MDLKKVATFKKEIKFNKTDLLSQYGLSTQKNLSRLSGQMLKAVKDNQAAVVGGLLDEMLLAIKDIDRESPTGPGLIARAWNKILAEVSLSDERFGNVPAQMDYIVQKLEESKQMLLEDSKKLQQTYEQHVSYCKELEALIVAGKEALIEECSTLETHESVLLEFEKQIADLTMTHSMALQTLPLIRIVQHDNNELVKKIQFSISDTIPLWKEMSSMPSGDQEHHFD